MIKHWTYDEIKYLKNSWGSVSIESMARRLNRSINAIKLKAQRIGLKDQRLYMSEMSLNQLQKILFNSNAGQMYYKSKNMPFTNKKIVKETIKVIDMDKFWDWLNKNKHSLSLHNTDEYSFGFEPAWVQEKRSADKRAYEYTRQRPWTQSEDERLKSLLKEYRYGYRELSIMLKRTEGAIKRRMLDLSIKERPLIAPKHIPWKPEEIKIVKDMYLKGYNSCIIAEYVERSALAINGLIERHNYFRK